MNTNEADAIEPVRSLYAKARANMLRLMALQVAAMLPADRAEALDVLTMAQQAVNSVHQHS